MALEEKRVLKQVNILPEQNSINVQWADQILRDGEVISEKFHRSAYSLQQKDRFSHDVEGAEKFLAAAGWV